MCRDDIIALAAANLTPVTVCEQKMPCVTKISQLMELCRAVVFPEYYCENASLFLIGRKVEKIYDIIVEQINETAACNFVSSLSEIKRIIMTDVEAVYNGDPAAKSHSEVIFCYPAITAILYHRIAHNLCSCGEIIIPRIISEFAHSSTGIDIHPKAQIDESFSIDHGTGVVIGETTIIGRGVRLYQGVTLGARSFRVDDNGHPINIPRHPIIGNNVVIYSNTSVLGRIEIGDNSIIGGNVWLTESVPPGSKITQSSVNYSK